MMFLKVFLIRRLSVTMGSVTSHLRKPKPRWIGSLTLKRSFAGGIGINHFQSQHYCAEMGFWLLPQFWGQGILKELIPLVFQYAVSNWNLHRMEAVAETENLQCIKLLEKTGFVFEGCRRECEYKNGKFIDLNIYAKLAK